MGGDLRRTQHTHPGGGQLESEGQAVEAAADGGDGGHVGRRDPEARLGDAGPGDEEGRSVRTVEFDGIGRLLGRQRQARGDPDGLPRHGQHLAAGSQHGHIGASAHHPVDELRHRPEDVLTVVDDEEQTLLVEAIGDSPTAESLADALWCIVMLPEFQLVR